MSQEDRTDIYRRDGRLIYSPDFLSHRCEAYREPGAVPVGWMWFLAYSTMIFVYLSTAISTLILDIGNFGDGES